MKVTKKTAKIINIVIIALTLIAIGTNFAFATDYLNPSTVTANSSGGLDAKAKNITGSILGVAQIIGVAVAIIMLIWLAIKYVTSAPNDKAEIKKYAVVYIVGAVVLFGASGLLGIIKGWTDNVIK